MATQSAQLSELQRARLIELVRPWPMLYDMGLKGYRDVVKKQEVWTSIAEKMAIPGVDHEIVAKKWKGLAKKSTGSAKDQKVRWAHYESMGFMERHLGTGDSFSNLTEPTASSSSSTDADLVSQKDLFAEENQDSFESEQKATPTTPAPKRFKRSAPTDVVEEKLVALIEIAQQQEAARAAAPVAKTEKDLFGELVAKKVQRLDDDLFSDLQLEVLQLIREKTREQERRERTIHNYIVEENGNQYEQLNNFHPLASD